jgi:hypothetical protein
MAVRQPSRVQRTMNEADLNGNFILNGGCITAVPSNIKTINVCAPASIPALMTSHYLQYLNSKKIEVLFVRVHGNSGNTLTVSRTASSY